MDNEYIYCIYHLFIYLTENNIDIDTLINPLMDIDTDNINNFTRMSDVYEYMIDYISDTVFREKLFTSQLLNSDRNSYIQDIISKLNELDPDVSINREVNKIKLETTNTNNNSVKKTVATLLEKNKSLILKENNLINTMQERIIDVIQKCFC